MVIADQMLRKRNGLCFALYILFLFPGRTVMGKAKGFYDTAS